MNMLLDLLKRRWLVSLLGVLALMALVLFGAPYTGNETLASPVMRLMIMLLILAIWGFVFLFKQIKATRASGDMIDDLADSTKVTPAKAYRADKPAEAVVLLQRQFKEALDVLKQQRKKDGGGNVYSLPWYIIIGRPAVGKTTALHNSGLKFPLQERFGTPEVKGVGGTQGCDWLFTDQAVLIDTAGKFVSQDDAAADSTAWQGFLNLLKKHRRRRPINGVLVAVSIAELMQSDPLKREQHVNTIKQRIHELYDHFGIDLPVYVLLTKCDLLAGFTEFFDDMGREDRTQVWGFTLPRSGDDDRLDIDISGQFEAEFVLLLERLNARLLTRLNDERNPRRRNLIFGFPRQLASLKTTLSSFLVDVFQPNGYEAPFMLRGVYLTSGTQEGTPIDRLMSTVAHTFGLQQQVLPARKKAGRAYFINRLLKDVVFREAGLASYNSQVETWRAWLQRGSYVAVLAIAALAAVAWLTSYTANMAHVKSVEGKLDEYQQRFAADAGYSTDDSVVDLLPRLNALSAIVEEARKHEVRAPLRMQLGLYQGASLAQAAENAYLAELNNTLVPLMAEQLANQMATQLKRRSRDSGNLYPALKIYLMLGDSEKMEKENQYVKEQMSVAWNAAFPQVAPQLQKHLDMLLKHTITPAGLNKQLVANVRQRLALASHGRVVYERLKTEASAQYLPDFRVSDVLGEDVADELFVRTDNRSLNQGIPGLFTYQGYRQFFLQEGEAFIERMSKDDWVLGEQADAAGEGELRLSNDVRSRYFDEYKKRWDEFLRDLRITSFRDVEHATFVLQILAERGSPVMRLLEAIADNTSLSRLPVSMGDNVALKGKAGQLQKGFDQMRATASQAGVASSGVSPRTPVDEYFQELNAFVQANGKRSKLLMQSLTGLYGGLMDIKISNDTSAILALLNDDSLQNDLRGFGLEPVPINHWAQQLRSDSERVAMVSARQRVSKSWDSMLRSECELALGSGLYPFDKDAEEGVSIDDFARFFAPDELLDRFFKEQLEPLVDTTTNIWTWQDGQASEGLRQMQRADAIREIFFKGGVQQPRIDFDVQPTDARHGDKREGQVVLNLHGQLIVYKYDRRPLEPVQWPGKGRSTGASIEFRSPDGDTEARIRKKGPWAWFRLLDQAQLQGRGRNFTAEFEKRGRWVEYQVRTHSAANPFRMRELREFRCPRDFQ